MEIITEDFESLCVLLSKFLNIKLYQHFMMKKKTENHRKSARWIRNVHAQ